MDWQSGEVRKRYFSMPIHPSQAPSSFPSKWIQFVQAWNPRWLIWILIFLGLGLFLFGAYQQATVINTNPERTDQSAYLLFAQRMKESGFTYLSDGARGPALPFLLTLGCDTLAPIGEYFWQAKKLSITLTLAGSVLLGLFFVRQFGWHAGLNATFLTAFSILMFRAPYVQAEPLFFLLLFAAFYLQWQLLQSPRPWKFAQLGVTTGFAYLAKASALPGFVAFLAIYYWQQIYEWGITRFRKTPSFLPLLSPAQRLKRFLWPAIAVLLFVAVLSPLIHFNKKTFGPPLYNVNTVFYVWYDSWEAVKQGTRAYGDRVGWPQMPSTELPSFKWYAKNHTFADVVQRIKNGYSIIGKFMTSGYTAGYYIIALSTVAALLVWKKRRLVLRLLFRKTGLLWAFALLYIGGYSLSISWFMAISPSRRFILLLFLPSLFLLTLIVLQLGQRIHFTLRTKKISALELILWLWSTVLACDVIQAVFFRADSFYGGN